MGARKDQVRKKPMRVSQAMPLRRPITMLKMTLWMELKGGGGEESFGNGMLLRIDTFGYG